MGNVGSRVDPGFFLPVRILSRLFRRLFLENLINAHSTGQLQFFGRLQGLANPRALNDYLQPVRNIEWVVYAKRPFKGPKAVLTYLSRYTHRVAIANSRLISHHEGGRYLQMERLPSKRNSTVRKP